MIASFEDFEKLDIRSGEVKTAELNAKARKPAYKMTIDFGESIGIKQSSAQLCDNYKPEDLIGKQITAVTNFPSMRVAGFKSEVLVLAIVCQEHGTILVCPDKTVKNGEKLA